MRQEPKSSESIITVEKKIEKKRTSNPGYFKQQTQSPTPSHPETLPSNPTHPSPKQPHIITTQTHTHTHRDKTDNKQVTFPTHATRINKYINR